MVSRDRPTRFYRLSQKQILELLPSPQPKRLWALFANKALSTGNAGALAHGTFNLKPLDAVTVSRCALIAARAPALPVLACLFPPTSLALILPCLAARRRAHRNRSSFPPRNRFSRKSATLHIEFVVRNATGFQANADNWRMSQ